MWDEDAPTDVENKLYDSEQGDEEGQNRLGYWSKPSMSAVDA